MLWNAPTSADQLKQKEILELYITQRVDGIAISALNGDFLTDTINRAVDSGIPVVTWDSDAPKSKRLAFCGVATRWNRHLTLDDAVLRAPAGLDTEFARRQKNHLAVTAVDMRLEKQIGASRLG